MGMRRNRPYIQFNFLVFFGDDVGNDLQAGFQEMSNVGMEVTVAEYRNGSITMKDGVARSASIRQWLDENRRNDRSHSSSVTIRVQNEDHSEIAQVWRLHGARIVKGAEGPSRAVDTDVAIEKLTLSYERLEIE